MTKGPDQPDDASDRRKRRALSAEDTSLWEYVTRDVRPTRGKLRVRIRPSQAVGRAAVATAPVSPVKANGAEKRQAPPPFGKGAGAKAPLAHQAAVEPVRPVVLERRKARRIARGHEEIDARLDLHGLTQDEAHRALEMFLRRAHADGFRTVIVITGKGGSAHSADDHAGVHATRERGVLRRMVPLWLDGASLRPIVIGFSNAHVRHGGGGALYVMLRRSGR